jgi:hypothetical protein
MSDSQQAPDKRDSPTVAEVRARMRDGFFKRFDDPSLQRVLREAATDPKMARQHRELFAVIRKLRPNLLPHEAKP